MSIFFNDYLMYCNGYKFGKQEISKISLVSKCGIIMKKTVVVNLKCQLITKSKFIIYQCKIFENNFYKAYRTNSLNDILFSFFISVKIHIKVYQIFVYINIGSTCKKTGAKLLSKGGRKQKVKSVHEESENRVFTRRIK
jgi:hypothetical protein